MSLFPGTHISGMFAKASVERVVSCLVRWGNQEIVGRSTSARREAASLDRAWDWVDQQRSSQPDRAILLPIRGGWTGFFNNDLYEFVPSAELFVVGEELQTDTCFFSFDDRADSVNRGSSQFCFSRFCAGKVTERQVILFKEESWRLQQVGSPLSFEETGKYSLEQRDHPLDMETLTSYGLALGIPFSDPSASGCDVAFLSWNTKATMSASAAVDLLRRVLGAPGLRWLRGQGEES